MLKHTPTLDNKKMNLNIIQTHTDYIYSKDTLHIKIIYFYSINYNFRTKNNSITKN